jgi:protein-disulfide isomerase/uncharacterized membrane protein/peroxiredoxin
MAKKKNKGAGTPAPPPTPPTPAAVEDAPLGAGARTVIVGAMLVACGVGFYLFRGFMLQTYGTDAFDSVCNVNETFNCDKINTSAWGKIGGIPITVFAMPTYLALALLAWFAGAAGERGRAALKLLTLGTGLAVVYGLFLLFIMATVEKTFCLFCMTMDVMALIAFVISLMAARKLGDGGVDWARAVGPAVGVGLLALVVTFGGHGVWKKSLIDQQVAALDDPVAATPTPGDAAVANATPAPAAGGDKAYKIDEKNYYLPVFDDDATYGNPDAKVTVIEYADFECGYCKKLFYSLTPLKKKYKDDVRFVFKHFPMNTKCNDTIQNNRHRYACDAAVAAECARRQGKFWPIHDLMFKNQHKLKVEDLRYYAEESGVEMSAFNKCTQDPSALAHIKRDIEVASQIEISGTPRTYINGRFLRGALPQTTLEKIIDRELGKAPVAAATPKVATKRVQAANAPEQVKIDLPTRSFYIDSFESSMDAKGRALSMAGVQPANATWYEAKSACEAAGKRLCTSEEWVSACQGAPAVDDDSDGNFANDYVEQNQFPYADWYEPRWCRDSEAKDGGGPGATGSMPRCQTPDTGIFDLGGNVAEWSGASESNGRLLGGDYRAKDKTGCFRRASTFGPGHKNVGIGFRCCSDEAVANPSKAAVTKVAPKQMDDLALPDFEGELMAGGTLSTADLQGKVVYLSFFASWCGPCRKELPELASLQRKYGERGFKVIAVGVDAGADGARKSAAMAKKYGGDAYDVILDPQNKVLGKFDVKSMPTTYIVDREGIIRHKQVGFGDTTIGKVEPVIEGLL